MIETTLIGLRITRSPDAKRLARRRTRRLWSLDFLHNVAREGDQLIECVALIRRMDVHFSKRVADYGA